MQYILDKRIKEYMRHEKALVFSKIISGKSLNTNQIKSHSADPCIDQQNGFWIFQ